MTLTVIISLLAYVGFFFMKSMVLDLIRTILSLFTGPIELILSYTKKNTVPIENLSFSKVFFNITVVASSIFMLYLEFGALRGILKLVYPDTVIPGLGVTLPTMNALVYVIIAVFLGFYALEWLGFKNLLSDILLDKESAEEAGKGFQSWDELKQAFNRPVLFFKYFLAFIFLGVLIVFSYWQGELAMLRDELAAGELLHSSSTTVAFLLGFFTPLVAAFALMTSDVFLASIFKVFNIILETILRIMDTIYNIIRIIVELFVGPMTYIANLIGVQHVPLNELASKTQRISDKSALVDDKKLEEGISPTAKIRSTVFPSRNGTIEYIQHSLESDENNAAESEETEK